MKIIPKFHEIIPNIHIFFLPDNDKWPVENPNFILIRFFPKTVKQISVMVTTFWSVGNKEIKKILK